MLEEYVRTIHLCQRFRLAQLCPGARRLEDRLYRCTSPRICLHATIFLPPAIPRPNPSIADAIFHTASVRLRNRLRCSKREKAVEATQEPVKRETTSVEESAFSTQNVLPRACTAGDSFHVTFPLRARKCVAIMMTDIEKLYECYSGDVRRFALYLCGDVAMADEITSDTFMRAWMAADRIRQPTVKSYLFSIARNAYIDSLRRAARHTQLDRNMPDTRISAQTHLEQSAEVRAVLAALQELPEIDRTVLLMRALDEMPYEEIAETLGISVVSAKVKVHRARLKLMQTRQAWREIDAAAGAKS
jgi:RNA polymerase sigma-70 factor, ECF subfamily